MWESYTLAIKRFPPLSKKKKLYLLLFKLRSLLYVKIICCPEKGRLVFIFLCI